MTSIDYLYPALFAAVVLMTLVWLVQVALVRRHARRYQEVAAQQAQALERLEAAARIADARAVAERAALHLRLVQRRGQLLDGRMRQQSITQVRALAVVEAGKLTATPAA